jgi:hypothetical protein
MKFKKYTCIDCHQPIATSWLIFAGKSTPYCCPTCGEKYAFQDMGFLSPLLYYTPTFLPLFFARDLRWIVFVVGLLITAFILTYWPERIKSIGKVSTPPQEIRNE